MRAKAKLLGIVLLAVWCLGQVPLPNPNVQPVTCSISAAGGTCATLMITNRTPTLYSFSITCPAVSANVSGNVTITNLATGSLTYSLNETTYGNTLQDWFPPDTGLGPGDTIVVTVPAISGGATCKVNINYGFMPAS